MSIGRISGEKILFVFVCMDYYGRIAVSDKIILDVDEISILESVQS